MLLRKLVIAGSILVYYLYFSWSRLKTHFADDDMMNLGIYFREGSLGALASQFRLWTSDYRPMGAAFYLPLYHWFGLNPAPYQLTLLLLVAGNAYLVYLLARGLGCAELESALAALITSYHSGLTNLLYNTDMVYDVLCFSFYVGALVYYVRIRNRGRLLGVRGTAIFLGLYICALNSKEMAVTLPFVLLSYELLYHGADWRKVSLRFWNWWRSPARALALACVLNIIFVYGRMFAPDALANQAAYRPVFTLGRVIEFQKGALTSLFCWPEPFGPFSVFAIWAVATYLCWRSERKDLRFFWFVIVIAPLPIEFLEGRFQGCLYIPMIGWAVLASAVLVDLARVTARTLLSTAGIGAVGRRRFEWMLIGIAVMIWAGICDYRKKTFVDPAAADQGARTWPVIQQLNALNIRVRPHSEVVFLDDPFEDYAMYFIGQLWVGDPSVKVHLQRKERMSPAEIGRVDYVFAFANGHITEVTAQQRGMSVR